MKTTLSFGLIVAAASLSLACSDEGEGTRGNGGSGTAQGGSGNTSNGGSGNTSNGGSTSGGSGGGGSSTRNYGPALVIEGEGDAVTVVDSAGMTGIDGTASVSQSMTMEVPAVHTSTGGKLCMTGTTAVVPGPDGYGAAWGAQIVLDLKQIPAANPAPSDAGADAGGGADADVETVAGPWDPGNVLGFSFKIDGPTVATALSVNSTPTGANPMTDNFCRRGAPPVSGDVIDVLFTDIRRDCWNMPPEAASLFQDPAGYTQLNNFIWQINADETIAHAFDFCISEIKPILP